MSDDINERSLKNRPYEESELWHILVSVIGALSYLKSNSLYDGDIRPPTVLIDYEGKVKILPRPFFSCKLNSYALFQ